MASVEQVGDRLVRVNVHHGSSITPGVLVRYEYPQVFLWPCPADLVPSGSERVALAVRRQSGPTGSAKVSGIRPEEMKAVFLPPADSPRDSSRPLGIIKVSGPDTALPPSPAVDKSALGQWIDQAPTWGDVLTQIDPTLLQALRPQPTALALSGDTTPAQHREVDSTTWSGDTSAVLSTICEWIFGD